MTCFALYRCFEDASQKEKWDTSPPLSTEEILDTLVADLRVRGVLKPDERPAPYDLALLIIQTCAFDHCGAAH